MLWTKSPIPSAVHEFFRRETYHETTVYSHSQYEKETKRPLHVIISDDKGETWNDYIIQKAKGNEFFIGFTSKNDGWMVSGHSSGVGIALNSIFQTSDGGKTWEEIGNPNETYSEHLTGVGFYNKDVGFLGFRYYQDAGPEIYWTKDRGTSWEKLALSLPETFAAYKKTPLSPTFIGENGKFPIVLTDHEAGTVGTIYLSSMLKLLHYFEPEMLWHSRFIQLPKEDAMQHMRLALLELFQNPAMPILHTIENNHK